MQTDKKIAAHSDGDAIRLNKYLAQCGVCSRRDADRLIAEGRVRVNGQTARTGQMVCAADTVMVGKRVLGQQQKVVLAYYKPTGVTCTERDAHAKEKVSDLVRYPVRVTYAGRLDKDSEGLLLLTNDGDLIHAMMRGSGGHEKEYVVKVHKEITEDFRKRMEAGIYLQELQQTTRPCKVWPVGKYTFRIVLTQGLNRQIRRMCAACGYQVKSLKRIRVLNVELGALQRGAFRELEDAERRQLYALAGLSTDFEEGMV